MAGARDCAPCKTWGFCSISKDDGRRGKIWKDACRVAGAVQERHELDALGDQGGFPERGCILEHQIVRFAKMILRDRCSTSYDLASLFRGSRNTLEIWTGKIAKHIGTRPSAPHTIFHYRRKSTELLRFWYCQLQKLSWCCQLQKMRKSRRIASFLTLSSSKVEEVSQNCFVFDVITFKSWGSLAEFLRFWRCQDQKLRKSRRIASFSSLQIDR